jgi:ubiquinone/menaquinone biosynthesis C-methylase UbiE
VLLCIFGRPVVLDIGGGSGKLANVLAPKSDKVYILDKEETSKPGSDNSLYAGSIERALKKRRFENILPIFGDATNMPFSAGDFDIAVAGELLEHLDDQEKVLFFRECYRVLKPGGSLIISTPNADYIERCSFWFSALMRKVVPRRSLASLPAMLKGPWLEQTVEEWEAKAGHYDRGCRLDNILEISRAEGFEMLGHRSMHTCLTSFWLQLMFTLPLVYILCVPLVRVMYAIESRVDSLKGIGMMMTFRKASMP